MNATLISFLSAIAPLRDGAGQSVLAVLIGAYILWAGCRAGTKSFLYALIGAVGAVIITKYVLLGCGVKWAVLDLHSVAAQAALPALLFGGFAGLLSTQLDGQSRFVPWLILGPLAVALAAGLVLVDHHDQGAVLIGLGCGILMAFALYRYVFLPNAPRLDGRLLVVLGIVVVVVFHTLLPQTHALIGQTIAWFKSCS